MPDSYQFSIPIGWEDHVRKKRLLPSNTDPECGMVNLTKHREAL